jgi:tryptophan 2-C-methyltransferase
MKVLLVHPNRLQPPVAPIGLDYLADSLRAAGHEPVLLDLCFSDSIDVDIEAAAARGGDLIGITVRNTDDGIPCSATFLLPGIRDIVSALRDRSEAPIVLGGAGLSLMPEAVADYCGADFAIAGEGEAAFARLADALRDGTDMDGVPGLLWWDETGLRRNPGAIIPLERLPPRTRSFVDNARYFRLGGQAGIETKRGCPMECSYCPDPLGKGRQCRVMPPTRVVEELRALLAQGIDFFPICDSEFNIPLEHGQGVCRTIVEQGLGERIRWYAMCSPVPFDAGTAFLFQSAGCAGIQFCADSGNADQLRRFGRHFGPGDLESTARYCRDAGIPFQYDILMGGPGETRKTAQETLDLMRRISPDRVGMAVGVRLFKGTPLARQILAAGPMESNRDLVGARLDNESLLRPVSYVSPGLGPDPEAWLREEVRGDGRFQFAEAMTQGARWDFLRRGRSL